MKRNIKAPVQIVRRDFICEIPLMVYRKIHEVEVFELGEERSKIERSCY